MAWSFSVGNSPATGSIAVYQLLTQLITAGWTKTKDSDGTTYSSGGTQVTSGNTGANGLANNNAWFVVKHPTANNAFCFQRGTSNGQWRISYCADDAFTAGSPSGTRIPAPGGTGVEVVFNGSGTDASPSFSSLFSGSDAAYKFHIIVGGAAEGYSFLTFAHTISSTNMAGGVVFFDKMVTGSHSASDTDPYVVGCTGGTSAVFASFHQSNFAARAWFGALSNSADNRLLGVWGYGGIVGNGVTLGSNPFTSKDDLLPVPWMRSTAVNGWKGISTLFKWPSVIRTNFDTYDVSGTRDYVFINNMVVPWDGSTPTL